jgi:splicing factor 3B subunit 3
VVSGTLICMLGQHIAVDPRGRAVMIAAIEKQKFVYVLTREEDKTIIQSPREAHKSHSICMDVVALDVGNENAMFTCL